MRPFRRPPNYSTTTLLRLLLGLFLALGTLSPQGPLHAQPTPAAALEGRVVRVVDGDTLVFLPEPAEEDEDGQPASLRVRLAGIDAPERGQPFGKRAKEFLAERAAGRPVRLLLTARDRYGRTVAEVLLADGTNVNHALVAAGLAWWYRKYAPGDKTLERLEGEARRRGQGLWSEPDPTPPWKWRSERRRRKR